MPSPNKKVEWTAENLQDPLSLPEGNIEALAFLVMMQASKSGEEDLTAVMDGVKEINEAKDRFRKLMFQASMKLLEENQYKLTDRQKKVLITYVIKPC